MRVVVFGENAGQLAAAAPKGLAPLLGRPPIKAGVSAGAQLVVTVGSNGYVTASPGAEGAKIPN